MPKNPQTAVAGNKDQASKAKGTAKKIAKPIRRRGHVVRTKPRFYRPNTVAQKRNSKVLRNLNTHNKINNIDASHTILIQPLSSDKNMSKMERENTLTFLVDSFANKVQIKNAFRRLYEAKVRTVKTLIRPDGSKKAYIRLAPGFEALKVASKIGIL
jgi:large subunit ribosomal protein L23Ae